MDAYFIIAPIIAILLMAVTILIGNAICIKSQTSAYRQSLNYCCCLSFAGKVVCLISSSSFNNFILNTDFVFFNPIISIL